MGMYTKAGIGRPDKSKARKTQGIFQFYEGVTPLKQDTTLDSLYMSILQEAFGSDHPESERDATTRSILGALTLTTNPLSPSAIASLLAISPTRVIRQLSSMQSLLILHDADRPVRPFHKSFPDFIVDEARCTNERFRVSPPSHHLHLLVKCLELVIQKLEKNMCKLPDAVTNSEVDDLEKKVGKFVDPALRYACKSWHKHLVGERVAPTSAITSTLHRFLENKFLFWLEVLSVIGAVREAVDALQMVAKWLEVCHVSTPHVLPKCTGALRLGISDS